MFRTYLGGLTSGRLGRLSFLGHWLLLWVLFALYGLGLAFAIGLTEPLVCDGPLAARDYLAAHFGPAVLAAFALFCLCFFFAQFNLIAKRIRDMGLPGWTVLLVLALASGALAYVLPPGGALARLENQANGGLNGLFVLALLLIPGGLFARQPAVAPAPDTAATGTEGQPAAPESALAETAPTPTEPPGTAADDRASERDPAQAPPPDTTTSPEVPPA